MRTPMTNWLMSIFNSTFKIDHDTENFQCPKFSQIIDERNLIGVFPNLATSLKIYINTSNK